MLGSTDDLNLIGRIRGKYVLYQHTYEGELLSPEAASILREMVARGYVLSVDQKNMFTLTKGSSQSYFRSNEDIINFGGIFSR